jgi:glycosyltransferase involved in cell wall biosynthesis
MKQVHGAVSKQVTGPDMPGAEDYPQRAPVSVMVFTLNEDVHLPRCLASLGWTDDVIIVDSFSTDETRQIAESHGARFYQHPFEGFGSQRNWALDNLPTKYPWILILDADERVPAALAHELGDLAHADPPGLGAGRVRRRFYMWGRWLRYSSLYPTWVVRFVHRDRVRYVNRGHAETQAVQGAVRNLQNDLIDENQKGLQEWFERQNRYSSQEADYELAEERKAWSFADLWSSDPLVRRAAIKRISWRMPARGFGYFVYSYLWRRGFLDGKDGFVFCRMKALYQSMVAVKKYDRRRSAVRVNWGQ